MVQLIFSALIFCDMFAAPSGISQEGFILNPRVRAKPPGARAVGVFFDFDNRKAAAKSIVSAASPEATEVEIHETIKENGIARMVPVAKVLIPKGKIVKFKPGGLHLMLKGPKTAMKVGERVTITLTFASGKTQTFAAPVVDLTSEIKPGGHVSHGKHKHKSRQKQKSDD